MEFFLFFSLVAAFFFCVSKFQDFVNQEEINNQNRKERQKIAKMSSKPYMKEILKSIINDDLLFFSSKTKANTAKNIVTDSEYLSEKLKIKRTRFSSITSCYKSVKITYNNHVIYEEKTKNKNNPENIITREEACFIMRFFEKQYNKYHKKIIDNHSSNLENQKIENKRKLVFQY